MAGYQTTLEKSPGRSLGTVRPPKGAAGCPQPLLWLGKDPQSPWDTGKIRRVIHVHISATAEPNLTQSQNSRVVAESSMPPICAGTETQMISRREGIGRQKCTGSGGGRREVGRKRYPSGEGGECEGTYGTGEVGTEGESTQREVTLIYIWIRARTGVRVGAGGGARWR